MTYNPENIFAKIIKKEIPAKIILETTHSVSFYDINPKANTHYLVIPKGNYCDIYDFYKKASKEEVLDFNKHILETTDMLNIKDSFQVISNCGENAGQEVFHFHIHIKSNK